MRKRIKYLKEIYISLNEEDLRDSKTARMIAKKVSELFFLIGEHEKAEFWEREAKG